MKIPSQDVITYVEIINLLQREIKGKHNIREPHRATRTHSLKEKMSSMSLCDAQSYLLFLLNNIYYRIHFQAPWTNVASAQPSLTAWTLLLHIFPCPMESHSLTSSTGMFLNLHQNISTYFNGKAKYKMWLIFARNHRKTKHDLFLPHFEGKLWKFNFDGRSEEELNSKDVKVKNTPGLCLQAPESWVRLIHDYRMFDVC